MQKILDLAINENDLVPVPDVEGLPVKDEVVIQNINDSKEIDVPLFTKKESKKGCLIYVGAGPTMPQYIEEIKQKQKDGKNIITSNMTYDWLIDRGIVADFVLIIDPKERVADYIKKVQPETQFYVGVVCDKNVINKLLKQGAKVEKLLIGYGTDRESDILLQKEIYGEGKELDFLVGGTMTGLRVMNFAIMLGYGEIDMYGVDSSYSHEPPKLIVEGDPLYKEAIKSNADALYEDSESNKKYAVYDPPEGGWFYAYKKKHHGSIQIAQCPDGRKFWTSPVFAHQAKQFVKWMEKLEGKLHVNVFGDSLTNHLVNCHFVSRAKRKQDIGDRFWSDDYKSVFKEFFSRDGHVCDPTHIFEILDKGSVALSESLKRPVEVLNYDQMILGNEKKEPFDVVHSINILEHIEYECVENVLKNIKSLAKYMVVINITLGDTEDTLIDGREAHLTVKTPEWWMARLKSNFDVIEAEWRLGNSALFICQSLDAKEHYRSENVATS